MSKKRQAQQQQKRRKQKRPSHAPNNVQETPQEEHMGVLPNHASARPLRQSQLLQMQQERGNAHVQRLLNNGNSAQLQEENGSNETVGNPLVGLKHRDGLDYGTWERRPRVKLLQDKLNQKMLAGLNVDGMFGDKTRQVLEEFQLSIEVPPHDTVDPVTADALMGKQKKEVPPGPVPPLPGNGGFNPALEDILDAVWNANHFILLARRDGLAKLGRQLKKDASSRFSDDIKGPLTDAAKEGLHKATDEQRDELITGLVGETAKSVVVKVLDLGFSPAVEFLVHGAIDLAIDLFAPEPKDAPDGTAVDVFVEGQTKTVTDAAFQAEQTFITQGKQDFRKKEADEPGQGLAQAQELLAALKTKQKASQEGQYDESLTRWMLMMAQEDLGKHLDSITEEDMGTEMGDLSKVETARGVLKITVFGLSPDHPLIIDPSEQPRIAGLTEAARKKLKEKKINEMGIPVLAEGENLGKLRPDAQNPQGKDVKEDVAFRANEKNTVWGWDKPMNVKIWLQQKQAGNKPVASSGNDQAAIDGLLIALRNEVGEQKLSQDIKDE
jgi:peptidoglycan hydrolase-like protein with peptidoglycan-binding domain